MAFSDALRIRPAGPADAAAIARIYFAAFAPSIAARLMKPHGLTADTVDKFRDMVLVPEPGRELHVFVAETPRPQSPGTYDIVAFSKFGIYRKARPEEEWSKPHAFKQEEVGKDVDLEAYRDFIGGLMAVRRNTVRGEPHMALDLLAVDPAYQRLGAGSALLRRGAELADAAGLTTWVEASPPGYPLYLRKGFVPVDTVDLPATEKYGAVQEEGDNWGAECAPETVGPLAKGYYRCVLMKRPAMTN